MKINSLTTTWIISHIALFLISCSAPKEIRAEAQTETNQLQPTPTHTLVSVTRIPTLVPQENLTCAHKEKLCVGLVTDVGQLNDKSFNQSAWEGVVRAKTDLLATVDYIETQHPEDYAANINQFVKQEFDIIVTVGFGLAESTTEAAHANPEIDFIGVDQFQENEIPNLAGLIFPEKEAGFLAGALAAMVTKTDIVGAILGPDFIPPIVAFKEGYALGVRAIDEEITVLHQYHSGPLEIAFTDSDWGTQTAQLMLDQGADVIFAAAGSTGNAALVETANNSTAFCIGVDTDQWLVLEEAHRCLLTSAQKEIQSGVFELISWSLLNDLPAGNFVGDVSLAGFHDFDPKISASAKSLLTKLDVDLSNNTIPLDGSYQIETPPSLNLRR